MNAIGAPRLHATARVMRGQNTLALGQRVPMHVPMTLLGHRRSFMMILIAWLAAPACPIA